MYLRILLTTTLSIAFVINVLCQDGFPFALETDNHSSYHGLITSTDSYSSAQKIKNTRFEDTYTEISPNPTPTSTSDNNGNSTEETIVFFAKNSSEEIAKVKILYTDAGYSCYNNLELTLGFETYNMSDAELNLSLPKGRYYYKVKGNLDCSSTDGCQIDNTGIVDIDENGTLYLSWQVTDYQNCWMSLRTSNYYNKVID